MINVSSNLALFGPFDSFTATSKACVGMVWTLLRVHEVHSTLTTTWPYLCTFSKNNAAILVFNTVFSVLNSWTRAMNNNNARVRLFGHLTTKNYIGLTEGTFKQRFSQHKSTFKHRKHINWTAPSFLNTSGNYTTKNKTSSSNCQLLAVQDPATTFPNDATSASQKK